MPATPELRRPLQRFAAKVWQDCKRLAGSSNHGDDEPIVEAASPGDIKADAETWPGEPGASVASSPAVERAQAAARLRGNVQGSEEIEPVERAGAVGWWDWDLKTNQVTLSSPWKAMLGYGPEHLADTAAEWLSLVHPEDRDQLDAALAAHLAGRLSHLENEHRLRRYEGSYGWMLCRALAFRDATGKPFRVVGSHIDITRIKDRDPLTGLPNRGFLIERLGRALERATRDESWRFALLFLDLDRFKNVNYSLGHGVGDQLLRAVAGRLQATLRAEDSPSCTGSAVAHVGGDEFAVLLEGLADPSDATRLAKRIQEELQLPFNLKDHEVFTSASIGIAPSSPEYERPEDLLRDADTAMYRAKATGRGCQAVFDTGMHARAVSLLRIETELRRAVQREEFRVFYQPIVHLDSGRFAGFEALVRWQHPDGELLLPKDFLAVAEETTLIIPIERLVLREVCRQLRAWTLQFRSNMPFTVSVNVSGVQFMRPDMIVEIDRTLRTYGVYGHSLELEITESVIMEHAKYAADMLQQLKALDVKLSIDDFGTGYSSLSYLRRFEIDTLKIDSSFISRIDSDEESWEIIRTIVTLGNNLGKEVIAEGIERAKQRERLLALRCSYGQGFFFSKPVAADAATALLAADMRGETLLKTLLPASEPSS